MALRNSQLLEHDLSRRLLGGLFRAAVPDPGLLAVHVGGTGEGAVMRRPVDIEHRIAHRLPAPRERLLNLGLEIDVTGQRVLDPRRESLHNRLLDLAKAMLEEESCKRRLEQ